VRRRSGGERCLRRRWGFRLDSGPCRVRTS
jgi:hypothetical protein